MAEANHAMAETGSVNHRPADNSGVMTSRPADNASQTSEKHTNNEGDSSSTQGSSSGNGLSSPKNEVEEPPRLITGWKWHSAYIALIVCVFLFSMDNTVVADIQPSIIEAFGGIDKLPWIGLGFQAGAMTVLPAGQAYGTFSLKPLFLVSLLLFEVGSAICGAAPNMNAMIIGRVITGIGGAATYTGCLTYLTVLTTPRDRPMYMSGIAVMYSVGSVLGPIVGGAFAHSSATWRWAFYINLPFAALLCPIFLFCIPKIDPQPTMGAVEKVRQQDWVGIVVYYGFSICFTMAISFGGSVYAWDSGSEITLWVMTGVLLIAFSLVTYYHPFVPSHLKLYPAQIAKKLELDNLQYQLFSAFGVLLISVYYTPLFFQFTRGDSAIEAGVRLLPLVCMIGFFSIVSGVLMPKFGYHMPWYLVGNGLVLAGSACMYTINENTPASHIYGFTILIGIGIGFTVMAGFPVVQAMLPESEANAAVGFMAFGQALGGIVVLGVAGSIFQNLAPSYIAPALPDASPAEIRALMAGTGSAAFKNLDDEASERVVAAIAKALAKVFAVNIAFTAAAFVFSAVMSRKRLWS